MAVNLNIPDESAIYPVAGVEIGIAQAGIKKPGHDDLTLFKFTPGTSVAGVFTRNRFRAAPVQICESRLATSNAIRALVINTGNANAGTGADGLERAFETCRVLSKELGLLEEEILPFSTGVILEPLPVDKITSALPECIKALDKNAWLKAAHSIMTTDTLPKICSRQLTLDGRTVTITGVSKGAGMIRPNMATMLGFVATDAEIAPSLLKELVKEVANQSFNRITVDGDTSTNDSFIVIATGQSGIQVEDARSPHYDTLKAELTAVARELAQKIVRDAEGATKFITIQVEEAESSQTALKIAYAIAHSPLVKTAFYASDPNLGRILAAIGYAGVDDLNIGALRLWLDDVLVASDGGRNPDYLEEDGQRVMQQAEILVRVALGRGNVSETVYSCDFSHEYVSINADYRS